jgi:hypothetical protein
MPALNLCVYKDVKHGLLQAMFEVKFKLLSIDV